jgi:iron complex outermembrane receptor protein
MDSQEFENVSYTLGADYRFTDSVLGYAKYSTGFKSGGWSPDAFSGTAVFLPVDEETLDSFEIGVKSEWNDSLRVNAAAFFNTYEGLQIGATVPGLGFTRFNVDETEISGLELEAVWQITDNFQINANAGFLDAEYTSLTGDQARGLSNNGAGCPAGTNVAVDAEAIACALGLDLKNAPEYKTTLGALFTSPIYNGELIISGDVSFEDETWSLVANSPQHALIDFDAITNARVKYQDDRGWSVAIFGRNLSDVEYYRASSASSFTTYASPPLEYGIEFGAEF